MHASIILFASYVLAPGLQTHFIDVQLLIPTTTGGVRHSLHTEAFYEAEAQVHQLSS